MDGGDDEDDGGEAEDKEVKFELFPGKFVFELIAVLSEFADESNS